MPVYTQSWSPVTDGLLSFTNIWVNEIDIGFTNPFVNTASQPQAIDGPVTGIIWGGFGALTYGAGSSQTLTFNYDVTSNSATDLIYSFNSLYAVDVFFGAGANLVATANIYDSGGGLIASQTYTAGGPLPNAVSFVQAQQSVHVTLTISEYIDAGDTGFSAVDLSAIMQIFDTMPTDQLCSIGDYVWLDLDGDGLQTAPSADPGIGGVVVQLLDADDLSVLAITTTNENGFYLFDNLLAGTYIVKFVTPDGFVFSPQGVGSNETIDSDADTATGMTGPITLEAGDHVRSVDAGLTIGGSGAGSTASLGDYVWIDANGNGIQDTGEAGLAGVTVNLLNDTGSVILATTTTNSLGQYAFTNLAAGTYVVQFVRPDGYVFTSAAQGLNNAVDSDADVGTGLTGPITLTAGQVNATIDAGLIYCAPATASIGNYVWFDCNGNGKQDSGESGIGGVTVQLMNATGTTVLATTVTNSSGFYQFTGLAAGTYQVYFGTKSGYQLTAARQGTDITKDSNPDPTTRLSGPITVTAGD